MERYRNMYRCDTMRLFPRQCHYEFEATSVNMQRHNDLCARLARVGEILANARKARTAAATAGEQIETDLEALLAVMNEGFAPEATKRDGD